MKFFGSMMGKSGNKYRFDRGQIIDAPIGEFEEEYAEDISRDFEKKTIDIAGQSVETAEFVPKKRGRKPKK